MKQFAGIVVRFLLRLWFRIEVHGAEHVRQNRPSKLLIVSNHVSFIDGILLGAFLPFEPTYLIHTAFVDRWYLRPWLKLIRYLALDTTSPLATASGNGSWPRTSVHRRSSDRR